MRAKFHEGTIMSDWATFVQTLWWKELTSNRGRNVGMSPGGLGLYVSHQIIKAHGNTIRAQSEGVGKGSTFFIELPECGNEIG